MNDCHIITSIKDERVVEARALSTTAGRQQRHKCLLEDTEVIEWALDAGIVVEHVFFHNKLTEHPFLDTLRKQQIECWAVSDGILKKISNTRYLIPFIGVGRIPADTSKTSKQQDFVIVLDDVRDLGNIGTIVRTARAFGIRDLVATQPEFDLYYKKTIDASRGKVFDVRVTRYASADETIACLKRQGFQIIATSPYAPVVQGRAQLQPRPIALVVGNETSGVSDELLRQADLVVQIPMSGQVESLNVGVATGISIYEFKLKLVLAMLVKYIRTTLGREINVTGKYIQLALDKELAAITPLNSTQAILLMILKCDQRMTLEQASKDTAAFGEELQQVLQPLFAEGYIRSNEDDSPATIELTDKGEHLLGQLWGFFESTEDKMLTGFSESEKAQLQDFLKRIQDNCGQLIEPEPSPESDLLCL